MVNHWKGNPPLHGSTQELLNKRAKTHGDYGDHARLTQALKSKMSDEPGWARLDDCQAEALHMIAHKIGRILAGNPSFKDHWDDIAGYAKLVADRCPGA
jgi:hypothetical protein